MLVDETGADQPREIVRQRFGGERTRRDDYRVALGGRGNRGDFFAREGDKRMTGQHRRDRLREPLAVHGERRAGRDTAFFRGAHHERAQAAHLLLEKPHGVVEFVASKGVAADQLGEAIGLVHRRGARRPHLVERHRHAARSGLPRGLAPGQATSDDADRHQ